jgi:two-component system chemotaxis response regulator CheY
MGLRVVVLDDEDLVRRTVARVLRRARTGEVLEASTNADAASLIAANPIDLLLMDFNRPGGTALDMLRATLAQRTHRRWAVVVLTGDETSAAQHKEEMVGLGAHSVLLKPISPAELLGATDAALNAPPGSALLASLLAGREDREVDYKYDLDLDDPLVVAKLAKDVLAMRNSPAGGVIFLGVAEHPTAGFDMVGLPDGSAKKFDPSRVNDKLRKYVGDAIAVRVQTLPCGSRTFAAIIVDPGDDGLALAQVNHERAGLFRGRIYVRTDAARSEQVSDNQVLTDLIERLVQRRIARGQGR